jgi:hypothetical protein
VQLAATSTDASHDDTNRRQAGLSEHAWRTDMLTLLSPLLNWITERLDESLITVPDIETDESAGR